MSLEDQETFSFKLSKDFAEAFAKVCFELDRTKSEVIRECIRGYLPILLSRVIVKDHPYLNSILNTNEK